MPTPVRAPNRGVASSATCSGSAAAVGSASGRRRSELLWRPGLDLGQVDHAETLEVAPVLQAAGEDRQEQGGREHFEAEDEQRAAEDDAARLVEGPRSSQQPPADEDGRLDAGTQRYDGAARREAQPHTPRAQGHQPLGRVVADLDAEQGGGDAEDHQLEAGESAQRDDDEAVDRQPEVRRVYGAAAQGDGAPERQAEDRDPRQDEDTQGVVDDQQHDQAAEDAESVAHGPQLLVTESLLIGDREAGGLEP